MDPEAAVSAMYDGTSFAEHVAAVRVLGRIQQSRLGGGRCAEAKAVDVRSDACIPPLSWLCTVAGGSYSFVVGSGVESGPGFIVEGVWDGVFDAATLRRSEYVFGSGAVFARRVVFIPPKHCWEYLYVLHDRRMEKTFVSNSLNFIFARSGVDVDCPFFALVEQRLNSSTDDATRVGVDLYDPRVAADDRYTFLRMIFYNFMADGDGNVELLLQAPEKSCGRSYAEYRGFLERKIQEILMNGAHPNRRKPLRPLTSISRGYDSICSSILARPAGCGEAITIDVNVKGVDDGAVDIAGRLGYSVIGVRHIMGEVVPKLAADFVGELRSQVLEFAATAGLGDDITFLAFEPHLRNRILVNGAMGDSVWRRNSSLPPGLPVRVRYGKSITEYRLRVGFAFLPVPALGARFPRPIKKITRSSEMSPYTLWAAYDRPFPRRVIEEAGISRGTFALRKAATSPTPMNAAALFRPAVQHVMQRYR